MEVAERILELKQQHDNLQLGLQPNDFCLGDGVVIKCLPECVFGFEFFSHRSPEMAYEMRSFIKYAKGRKCFVDVGALWGIFSFVFGTINPLSSSYAFEPSPDPFSVLLQNCGLNHRLMVRPIKAALSDKFGIIPMKKEWDHYVECPESEKELDVQCIAGDNYFSTDMPVPIEIDTIKIDTEGSELNVLNGLKTTIEMYHPVIFLELHNHRLPTSEVEKVVSLVRSWNYKILDSATDSEISDEQILSNNQSDMRLILL